MSLKASIKVSALMPIGKVPTVTDALPNCTPKELQCKGVEYLREFVEIINTESKALTPHRTFHSKYQQKPKLKIFLPSAVTLSPRILVQADLKWRA
jgi:hypothetical protein